MQRIPHGRALASRLNNGATAGYGFVQLTVGRHTAFPCRVVSVVSRMQCDRPRGARRTSIGRVGAATGRKHRGRDDREVRDTEGSQIVVDHTVTCRSAEPRAAAGVIDAAALEQKLLRRRPGDDPGTVSAIPCDAFLFIG